MLRIFLREIGMFCRNLPINTESDIDLHTFFITLSRGKRHADRMSESLCGCQRLRRALRLWHSVRVCSGYMACADSEDRASRRMMTLTRCLARSGYYAQEWALLSHRILSERSSRRNNHGSLWIRVAQRWARGGLWIIIDWFLIPQVAKSVFRGREMWGGVDVVLVFAG